MVAMVEVVLLDNGRIVFGGCSEIQSSHLRIISKYLISHSHEIILSHIQKNNPSILQRLAHFPFGIVTLILLFKIFRSNYILRVIHEMRQD